MELFSWMMHPAMLAAGSAAMALPVIIHLLNRRRFRIVDWAAMEFLLEANRRNRRRIRLEHLILLLLRCVAMLLLGLLLARPFLPGTLAQLLRQKQRIERVVLLDDSLSQRAMRDATTGFDAARKALLQMMEQAAGAEDSDNWLTVYCTSRPDQPLLAWEPLTPGTLPALTEQINRVECSETGADYAASLAEVARYLAGQRDRTTRITCLIGDLRQRDWGTDAGGRPALRGPLEEIGRLSGRVLIVDSGGTEDGNLAIESLRSADLLVAGRTVQFEVGVANWGRTTVTDIPVVLEVDGRVVGSTTVASLGPGRTELVTFRALFPADDPDSRDLAAGGFRSGFRNHRVVARIDRAAMNSGALQGDVLLEDNQRPMAARLLDGIPVLLVDGDPSPVPERGETWYLRNLNVPGTGVKTTVVGPAELETVSLSDYRVVFICNVDEVSANRIRTLEQWVRDGGAVVLMPGNQVRAGVFNEVFWREGEGLSPLGLDAIDGDASMENWVNLEPQAPAHPALRTILGSDATGLTRVEVFQWWKTMPLPAALDGVTTTVVRLNDPAMSPAMVDRPLGSGRVIFFNLPGDGDWSIWPAVTGAWVPVMLDLVDYLAASAAPVSELQIGGSLRWPLDLSAWQSRVVLRNDRQEKVETEARLSGDAGGQDSVLAAATFESVSGSGFHELLLRRTTGEEESVLFAAGLPADESRLQRVDPETLRSGLPGDRFELTGVDGVVEKKVAGAGGELWTAVIWFLLAVLAAEQFLAWLFGQRRNPVPVAGGA